jgi:hypothetical protein
MHCRENAANEAYDPVMAGKKFAGPNQVTTVWDNEKTSNLVWVVY